MSYFASTPSQAITDAMAVGDFETVMALMDDQTGDLETYLAGSYPVNLTGTLDGSGNATVAHGLDLTGSTVILCQGFFDNGSGQHAPLTITYVDAANVVVTGGAASAAFHVTLLVAQGFVTF